MFKLNGLNVFKGTNTLELHTLESVRTKDSTSEGPSYTFMTDYSTQIL